jgi:hypothetical protein
MFMASTVLVRYKMQVLGALTAIAVVVIIVLIMLSPGTVRFWRALHGSA